VILIISLVFVTIIFGIVEFSYLWWLPEIIPSAGWIVLVFYPVFNFGKIYIDIASLALNQLDSNGSVVPGPGFYWENMTSYNYSMYPGNDIPPPSHAVGFFIMNFFLYLTLAWFFENVIPDEYGNRRPIYFMFLPSYWGFKPAVRNMNIDPLKRKAATVQDDEEDVKKESDRVFQQFPKYDAVSLYYLRKIYGSGFQRNGQIAVAGASWGLQEGKMLALLGQNGAGKTTTINMLCGFLTPTDGDALISGRSILTNMNDIRSDMGFCPQI